MNPFRKSLAIAVLSGGSVAALFGGSSLVRFGNAARAEDVPSQGKVQAPAQVTPQEQQQLSSLAAVFRKVGKTVEPSVVQITSSRRRRSSARRVTMRCFAGSSRTGITTASRDVPEGFNDDAEDIPAVGHRQRRHHGGQRQRSVHPDQQPRRRRRDRDARSRSPTAAASRTARSSAPIPRPTWPSSRSRPTA